jgi:AcrR family transcriptional regulator
MRAKPAPTRSRAIRPAAKPVRRERWAGEVFLDEEQEGKKHAILRAAARLFRERGFEQTRLTDIADALNITKPALYYYVGNKEEILITIQRMGLEQMLDGFDELVAGNKSGAELIAILLTRYGEWATTEFGVCVVRLVNVRVTAKNAKALYAGRTLLERKVRALFVRGMTDGSIKPCDPGLAATALFGSLNWMAFWYDRSRARLPPAEISARFIEYFMSGLGAGSGPASA